MMKKLLSSKGDQNPYVIQKELGKTMSDNVTIIRINKRMKQTLGLIEDLKNRYQTRLGTPDGATWSNQSLGFTRSVWDMLLLSEAITKAAIARDESRGRITRFRMTRRIGWIYRWMRGRCRGTISVG